MKITLESTTKIVYLRDEGQAGHPVPARIWEGTTESGIPVHAYITRIAVHEGQDQSQFVRELEEHRTPSAEVAAIPLWLII